MEGLSVHILTGMLRCLHSMKSNLVRQRTKAVPGNCDILPASQLAATASRSLEQCRRDSVSAAEAEAEAATEAAAEAEAGQVPVPETTPRLCSRTLAPAHRGRIPTADRWASPLGAPACKLTWHCGKLSALVFWRVSDASCFGMALRLIVRLRAAARGAATLCSHC